MTLPNINLTKQSGSQEILTEWVRRLRSGKLNQVSGSLMIENVDGVVEGYCCLGVLCEMAVEAGVAVKSPVGVDTRYYPANEDGTKAEFQGAIYEASTAVLPNVVMEWAGLRDNDPEVDTAHALDGGTTLSGLNDSYALNFSQIADVIEENFIK